jgi:hypothetical protein
MPPRRSSSQKTNDLRAFPIHAHFKSTISGPVGASHEEIDDWIKLNGGPRRAIKHMHGWRLLVLFRHTDDLAAFLNALPGLRLDDHVDSDQYRHWAKGDMGWNDVREPARAHTAGVATDNH